MGEKLKNIFAKIKEWWGKLSKTVKRMLVIGGSLLVAVAVGLTIWLNTRGNGYIVLFPGMSTDESTEVYKYLQSENVPTQINSQGEIMVPESQWDQLVYELAEKGYPQSAPSYGTYFDNLSMTMTDSEKQQLIIKDLQDRLQVTLNRIDGVKGSVVTIQYPEKSNYAWKENNEKASASVTLTLTDPDKFTKKNVQAVKNLVAYSTQQMKPEDVTVIDTTSGNELTGDDGSDEDYDINSRENYERIIRERIENNVKSILSKPYGAENVAAACNVSVNYDKIKEEMKKYLPEDNGKGVANKDHMEYKTQNADDSTAKGITGEENNTDTPSYPNSNDELTENNPAYAERDIEYSISQVLTQTEKAAGVITNTTIAITLKTQKPLSDDEKNQITQLVQNATSIDDTAKITVYDWQDNNTGSESSETETESSWKKYMWIAIAALLGVALITVIIILIVNKRKSKKEIKDADEKHQAAVNELEEKLEDTRRQTLIEKANENNKAQKETASEVKKFAQTNPELTAAIIRSMLKEDEDAKKENAGEEDDEL